MAAEVSGYADLGRETVIGPYHVLVRRTRKHVSRVYIRISPEPLSKPKIRSRHHKRLTKPPESATD